MEFKIYVYLKQLGPVCHSIIAIFKLLNIGYILYLQCYPKCFNTAFSAPALKVIHTETQPKIITTQLKTTQHTIRKIPILANYNALRPWYSIEILLGNSQKAIVHIESHWHRVV